MGDKIWSIMNIVVYSLWLIIWGYRIIKEKRKGNTKNIFKIVYDSESNSPWFLVLMVVIFMISMIGKHINILLWNY